MANSLIFISRPGNPGKQLAEDLQKLGFQAQHTPSLEIQAVAAALPKNNFDITIFISPTSVQASFELDSGWLSNSVRVIAVGPGTTRALRDRGYKTVLMPKTSNSEGLLAMDDLQQVDGKSVLIVKGEGGRALLQETLTARGADCYGWSVYRRLPAEIAPLAWHDYSSAEYRELTCASIETLDAFEIQRIAHKQSRPEQIYVASDRIADHARAVGYTGIIQVGGATNEHFITAIKQKHS